MTDEKILELIELIDKAEYNDEPFLLKAKTVREWLEKNRQIDNQEIPIDNQEIPLEKWLRYEKDRHDAEE